MKEMSTPFFEDPANWRKRSVNPCEPVTVFSPPDMFFLHLLGCLGLKKQKIVAITNEIVNGLAGTQSTRANNQYLQTTA